MKKERKKKKKKTYEDKKNGLEMTSHSPFFKSIPPLVGEAAHGRPDTMGPGEIDVLPHNRLH